MEEIVLFTYVRPSTFIEDDRKLLTESYRVEEFHFGDGKENTPLGLLRRWWAQYRWLRREISGAKAVLGWFADYHMVLPVWMARRRGIPVLVVLGGFDCHNLPELGYGVFASWRAPLARYVLRRASVLLPVTETLIRSENEYTRWPERRVDGIAVNVPGIRTPVVPLHTAYRLEDWPLGPAERERVVTTVAFIDSERTLKVKGVDVLIEAARLMPDTVFRIVGVPETAATWLTERYQPSPNVRLEPPRPRSELAGVYAESAVYAQLSRTEGVPNVLCEAMLCGCIPVGSPVSGIPEAIGTAGLLVERPEPAHIADVLRQALTTPTAGRARARQHIIDHFRLDIRRDTLLDLIGGSHGSSHS